MEVLIRRTKNNPVLIGEPGVGKTAVVEGLAQMMIDEASRAAAWQAPDRARPGGGAGRSKFRGEFEERLKAIVEEVTAREAR